MEKQRKKRGVKLAVVSAVILAAFMGGLAALTTAPDRAAAEGALYPAAEAQDAYVYELGGQLPDEYVNGREISLPANAAAVPGVYRLNQLVRFNVLFTGDVTDLTFGIGGDAWLGAGIKIVNAANQITLKSGVSQVETFAPSEPLARNKEYTLELGSVELFSDPGKTAKAGERIVARMYYTTRTGGRVTMFEKTYDDTSEYASFGDRTKVWCYAVGDAYKILAGGTTAVAPEDMEVYDLSEKLGTGEDGTVNIAAASGNTSTNPGVYELNKIVRYDVQFGSDCSDWQMAVASHSVWGGYRAKTFPGNVILAGVSEPGEGVASVRKPVAGKRYTVETGVLEVYADADKTIKAGETFYFRLYCWLAGEPYVLLDSILYDATGNYAGLSDRTGLHFYGVGAYEIYPASAAPDYYPAADIDTATRVDIETCDNVTVSGDTVTLSGDMTKGMYATGMYEMNTVLRLGLEISSEAELQLGVSTSTWNGHVAKIQPASDTVILGMNMNEQVTLTPAEPIETNTAYLVEMAAIGGFSDADRTVESDERFYFAMYRYDDSGRKITLVNETVAFATSESWTDRTGVWVYQNPAAITFRTVQSVVLKTPENPSEESPFDGLEVYDLFETVDALEAPVSSVSTTAGVYVPGKLLRFGLKIGGGTDLQIGISGPNIWSSHRVKLQAGTNGNVLLGHSSTENLVAVPAEIVYNRLYIIEMGYIENFSDADPAEKVSESYLFRMYWFDGNGAKRMLAEEVLTDETAYKSWGDNRSIFAVYSPTPYEIVTSEGAEPESVPAVDTSAMEVIDISARLPYDLTTGEILFTQNNPDVTARNKTLRFGLRLPAGAGDSVTLTAAGHSAKIDLAAGTVTLNADAVLTPAVALAADTDYIVEMSVVEYVQYVDISVKTGETLLFSLYTYNTDGRRIDVASGSASKSDGFAEDPTVLSVDNAGVRLFRPVLQSQHTFHSVFGAGTTAAEADFETIEISDKTALNLAGREYAAGSYTLDNVYEMNKTLQFGLIIREGTTDMQMHWSGGIWEGYGFKIQVGENRLTLLIEGIGEAEYSRPLAYGTPYYFELTVVEWFEDEALTVKAYEEVFVSVYTADADGVRTYLIEKDSIVSADNTATWSAARHRLNFYATGSFALLPVDFERTYSVTVKGQDEDTVITVSYGEPYDLTQYAPPVTGYAFKGWRYFDADGRECLLTENTGIWRIDFTHEGTAGFEGGLEAVYEAIAREVTYVVQSELGSAGDNPGQITVEDGSITLLPAEVTAAGYVFVGWYAEATFETPVTDIVYGESDITLYAKIAVGFTFTLGYPDGTSRSVGVVSGEAYTLPEVSGIAGYEPSSVWERYDAVSDSWIRVENNTLTPDADATFRLVAEPTTYTVTFDADGGVKEDGDVTYTVEDTFNFRPATREGYFFVGWYTADGMLVRGIALGTTGNLSLKAVWAEDTIPASLQWGVSAFEHIMPVPAIPTGSSYTVALFAGDTQLTLTENKAYRFTEAGEYRIVYTIYLPGGTVERAVALTVAQGIITVDGTYAESYTAGTELTLLSASTNAAGLTVSVEVRKDGEVVSAAGGKLTLAEGTYTVRYYVEGDSGIQEQSFSFTVVPAGKSGCGCNSSLTASGLAVSLAAMGAVLALAARKRKQGA